MAAKSLDFVPPDFFDGTSPEDIHERMMNNLPSDIDKMPGGFPYDMTMPSAELASEFINFHLMRSIMLAFPQWAWNDWLDLHGEEAGLERHEATYASGEITVEGTEGTSVPEGSVFSTAIVNDEPAVEFMSTENIIIGASGEANIHVIAVKPGIASNVSKNTVIMQNKSIQGITSVTNKNDITGGTEAENDDDYRERINFANSTEDMSYVGNDSDYKRWAMSVDGVGTCLVIPAWNGPGTVKLVLLDSAGNPASEDLCEEVYDKIVSPEDRTTRLMPTGTAELTVAPATTVTVSFTCTGISYDSTKTNIEQIKADFKSAIESVYTRAKELGKIVYHQAESLITDIEGVNDYESFLMNGTENDIELTLEQYPKTSDIIFS